MLVNCDVLPGTFSDSFGAKVRKKLSRIFVMHLLYPIITHV